MILIHIYKRERTLFHLRGLMKSKGQRIFGSDVKSIPIVTWGPRYNRLDTGPYNSNVVCNILRCYAFVFCKLPGCCFRVSCKQDILINVDGRYTTAEMFFMFGNH